MSNFSLPNFNLPPNMMPQSMPKMDEPEAFSIDKALSTDSVGDEDSSTMQEDYANFQMRQGHFDIMELLEQFQGALLDGNQQKLDDVHNELKLKVPGTDIDTNSFAKQMGSIIHIFKFQFTMDVQMQQQTIQKAGGDTQVSKQSFHARVNISFEASRMREVVESMNDNPLKQPLIDSLDAFSPEASEDSSETVAASDSGDSDMSETPNETADA